MASLLPNLPVEVIEAITDNLNPTSLFSLRLSCKEINQKTLHHFGQACFATLKTDLSHNDLQRLESISKSEQLRPFVQTLVINTMYQGRGRGFHWHRLEEGYLDTRLSSGVQLLQDILKRMTKCKSFRIFSFFGAIDDDPAGKYLRSSDVVGIILCIIAETNLPVTSFFVDFKNRGISNLEAKRLQMSLCQRPTFRNAWRTVEELNIEHSLTSETFGWAKDLVLHATSLKKLSLQFDFDPLDYTTSFIAELLASPRVFQGLQEFRLRSANVTFNVLSSILNRSSTNLRVLSLWHIYIQEGTWVAILEQLRDSIPLLESISINWPKEYINDAIVHVQFPALEANGEIEGFNGRKFELRYRKWKGKRRLWGADYHGRLGMNKALDILANSAVHT